VEEGMIESIFGSNAIENVGGTLRITKRICEIVFASKFLEIEHIDEGSPEYKEELIALSASGRGTDIRSVIRSRREIVQHALAMKYLIEKMVVQNEDLTEEILKETHRILMRDSEHQGCGGVYRTGDEAASHGMRLETDDEYKMRVKEALRLKPNRPPPERKSKPIYFSKFIRGKSVPIYMKGLVEEYNDAIDDGERNGSIDPFDLAAWAANKFVCIHPFEDGNGRMCRLLLNATLIKFAGTCVAIGADDADERTAYIEQACLANKAFTKEDRDEVEMGKQTSHRKLGTVVFEKMTIGLQKARDRLLER
jgi:Fic family protein